MGHGRDPDQRLQLRHDPVADLVEVARAQRRRPSHGVRLGETVTAARNVGHDRPFQRVGPLPLSCLEELMRRSALPAVLPGLRRLPAVLVLALAFTGLAVAPSSAVDGLHRLLGRRQQLRRGERIRLVGPRTPMAVARMMPRDRLTWPAWPMLRQRLSVIVNTAVEVGAVHFGTPGDSSCSSPAAPTSPSGTWRTPRSGSTTRATARPACSHDRPSQRQPDRVWTWWTRVVRREPR